VKEIGGAILLTKPFGPAQLLAQIKYLLESVAPDGGC